MVVHEWITQQNKIKVNRIHSKSIATPNDNKTLWSSLNPISQNVDNRGENVITSKQTNVKDRFEDIATTFDGYLIQEFM